MSDLCGENPSRPYAPDICAEPDADARVRSTCGICGKIESAVIMSDTNWNLATGNHLSCEPLPDGR